MPPSVASPTLVGCRVLAVALLWLGSASPAVTGPPRVTGLERYGSEKAARIVVRLSQPVRFERGPNITSSAAPELRVDLQAATYSGRHAFDVGGLVRRVRLLRLDTGLRIALDLSEAAECDVFYLPEPFRVVIDVSRREPAPREPPSGRSVERIALDPGHGGSDPGAAGISGIREKDIVLDIAHRAAPLLARELGVSTLLTRDVDRRVPLEERVARANAFGADLFISIHCNADGSRAARGVTTFVLDGSHDHRASDILSRENASPAVASREFGAFLEQFDDQSLVRGSAVFARLLQRAAISSLVAGYPDSVDGGVQGAGFYVLAGARMPAVLFETSFVSNVVEAERLSTGRYRQKLADAIVNAVRAYRAGY